MSKKLVLSLAAGAILASSAAAGEVSISASIDNKVYKKVSDSVNTFSLDLTTYNQDSWGYSSRWGLGYQSKSKKLNSDGAFKLIVGILGVQINNPNSQIGAFRIHLLSDIEYTKPYYKKSSTNALLSNFINTDGLGRLDIAGLLSFSYQNTGLLKFVTLNAGLDFVLFGKQLDADSFSDAVSNYFSGSGNIGYDISGFNINLGADYNFNESLFMGGAYTYKSRKYKHGLDSRSATQNTFLVKLGARF